MQEYSLTIGPATFSIKGAVSSIMAPLQTQEAEAKVPYENPPSLQIFVYKHLAKKGRRG